MTDTKPSEDQAVTTDQQWFAAVDHAQPQGFHTVKVTSDDTGAMVVQVDMFRPVRVVDAAEAPLIRITARVARRLLHEVVADFGKHHSIGSEACAYIQWNCPLCMVGCALYAAGLTQDELHGMDRQFPTRIGEVALPARVRITGWARRVFAAAQDAQDKGLPWGTALENACAVRRAVAA